MTVSRNGQYIKFNVTREEAQRFIETEKDADKKLLAVGWITQRQYDSIQYYIVR